MSVDALVWMTVGIGLLSAEVFTGTFHLMFFGLSALLAALLAFLGLDYALLQMLAFGVFCLCSIALMRLRLDTRSRGFSTKEDSEFQLADDLPPGLEIFTHINEVRWKAINVSSQFLARGDWARILRTEGITLLIEPRSKTKDSTSNK